MRPSLFEELAFSPAADVLVPFQSATGDAPEHCHSNRWQTSPEVSAGGGRGRARFAAVGPGRCHTQGTAGLDYQWSRLGEFAIRAERTDYQQVLGHLGDGDLDSPIRGPLFGTPVIR